MTALAYTITCGDQKARRAASVKGAKVSMGRMMNNVPTGTRGEIRCGDELVLRAECYMLGWFTVRTCGVCGRDYLDGAPACRCSSGPAGPQEPTAIAAEPWTARQCPTCGVWVYVADGPFAEDDPTKSLTDWFHWRDEHLPDEDRGAVAIGFPFFMYNDQPVDAVNEHRADDEEQAR